MLLLLIGLMFTAGTFAQSFQIQGVVTTSAATVADAAVTFINANDPSHPITTRTDAHGNYRLNILTNVASDQVVPTSFYLQQNYPNPFSSFIRPGFHRVDVTGRPPANVFLSAYRENSQDVIIAINTGTQTVEPIFILRDGEAAGHSVSTVRAS